MKNGFLFTDFYQLTMAQVYFRAGWHEKEARFEHFFRRYPNYGSHSSGYCINAGMGWLQPWLKTTRITDDDVERLRSHRTSLGEGLFQDDFLDWLKTNGNFDSLQIEAIPEGRVVHPYVPLTVVHGPLALAQIVETALLNKLNFHTLIATKAARIKLAARGGTVLEFGARRAQDGGAHAGGRAALIGGADFTSNTGLSYELGLTPKGTHAHSMVQCYLALGQSEEEAFQAYADLYPDDCVLLVDTIDTLGSGIPNAIKVFERLRSRGHKPLGVRLDSGDLAYLALQSSKMLDEAGFPEVGIALSNSLDELTISQILRQLEEEAPRYKLDARRVQERLLHGVGTNLITSKGDSALGGVYKLVSLRDQGAWKPAAKISESPTKSSIPGAKNVWRVYDQRGLATADLIGTQDESVDPANKLELRHPHDPDVCRILPAGSFQAESLLAPVPAEPEPLKELRQRCRNDLEKLDPGVKRLLHPHEYHVSLTPKLSDLGAELRAKLKGQAG